MITTNDDKKFARMLQKIDPTCKLLRTWKLQGGISAQVTALEIELPNGQTQKLIVRQHGPVDLSHNPHIAADEFGLLHLLRSAGLPTPIPYYLDQSCEIFSTPYLVIFYIEGEPAFTLSHIPDLIPQFATHLSRIHHVDCSHLDFSFLPAQEHIYARKLSERPAKIDDSLGEGHIRAILEAAWPLPQHNKSVLLHGDYWPGNILWRNSQLVGIIDWEDARFGDPLEDLANTRLETLWAFGIDAMQSFTHHYQSITSLDYTNLPYWDLFAALRPASKISEWANDPYKEKIMREQHRWFVSQAFAQL